MFFKLIILLVTIGFVVWAVKSRIEIRRKRVTENVEVAEASPMSVAIGELVAIAGGIYISLVLIVSFLKMQIPERVCWFNVSLDPLAMIAVIAALLQPIVILFYCKIKK